MTAPQPNPWPGPERANFGPPPSWRCYELSLVDQMPSLLDRIEMDLKSHQFSEKECFGIRLSLEEAIANAIRHGHKNDPDKVVRVAYTVTLERLLAEVEDQGPGFNSDAIPDPLDPENLEKPSGRGVFLMRAYMSWVKFNERGNRVTMCKTRGG